MKTVMNSARTLLPMLSGRAGWTARLALPLLCFAVACSRDDSATAPKSVLSAAAIVDPLALDDPQIDQTDSYLITTAVTRTTTSVESAEPFVDPLTGQQVTTLTFPDVVDSSRLEAGYDVSGVVRINESRATNDSGGLATRLQIVGNTATFYDANGLVVHDTAGPILMEALGSMDNVIVTSSAIIRDESTPLAPASSVSLAMAPGGNDSKAPRVEHRGDRLFHTWSLDDAEAGVRGERVRQFRKSGADWVVVEERTHTTTETGPLSFEVFETTTYPVVKWKTNEEKDAKRRARGAQSGPAQLASRGRADGLASLLAKSSGGGEAPAFNEGTLGTVADVGCLLCADGGGGEVDLGLTGGASLNIAYQHGAFADAGSWMRLDNYLSGRFAIANKVMPTFDWKQRIPTQAAWLSSAMTAKGGNRYLVIGHSNGGLVARQAAQNNAGGSLVGGVVAIASPHKGVPLVRNTRSSVNALLSSFMSDVLVKVGGNCGNPVYQYFCTSMNDALLTFVPKIVNYAFDFAVPVSGDVVPNGAYTGTLNAQPENFLRYSVEVESQGAWKFVRMMGDWKCNPEQMCSGDHLQNMMESAYDVLRSCGSNMISRLVAPSISERCRNVRWSLSNLNQLYERLTAPGDASDGLIPAKSQAYPGAGIGDRILMKNARESHAGELKSAVVHDRVRGFVARYTSQTI